MGDFVNCNPPIGKQNASSQTEIHCGGELLNGAKTVGCNCNNHEVQTKASICGNYGDIVNTCDESQYAISQVTIDDLPDEVMVKILSYMTFSELTEVAQNVCRRWKRLSHDTELWPHFHEYHVNMLHSDADVKTFLRQQQHLHSVIMHRGVTSSVIHALCNYCQNLNTLKIGPTQKMSIKLLRKLVEHCPFIKHLSIPYKLLKDERNAYALAQLELLQSLKLDKHSPGDGLVTLQPIANGCTYLSKLEMSTIHISVEEMEYFFKHKTLTSIVFPWTMYNKRCVIPLLKECTSLRHLELNNYSVLSDEAQEAFTALGHLSNLHSLTLNCFEGCPSGAVNHAFKSSGLSHLQELAICFSNDLEDSIVAAFCESCSALKKLSLHACRRLTDEALRQLQCLKHLETLDLTGCSSLGGAAIRYIARVPALTTLYLNGISLIQLQPGLEHILDITSLENLHLDWNDVSFFPFEMIPVRLVNLRVLNLNANWVDKTILEQLKKKMPGLTVFSILDEYFIDLEELGLNDNSWSENENSWNENENSWSENEYNDFNNKCTEWEKENSDSDYENYGAMYNLDDDEDDDGDDGDDDDDDDIIALSENECNWGDDWFNCYMLFSSDEESFWDER